MTIPTRETHPGRAAVATYRIRVAGVLGEEWSDRARGMTVAARRSEAGESYTELIGKLPDEAALMGILDALYSHGARLLSVEHVDEDGSSLVKPEVCFED